MADVNKDNQQEILSDNQLMPSRLRVINNLCQYSPFFVFPIAAKADTRWWFMLIAIIVVVCIGALYMNMFRRLFMPKDVRTDILSKGEKIFYCSMMLVVPVLTVVVYALPFFNQIISSILAIVVNYALTMFLCYKVAVK